MAGLARMTVAPGLPAFLSDPLFQLALATPVQFYAGWPFYTGALRALRHGAADMNTLIAVGTSAAYLYSVATILFPGFGLAALTFAVWFLFGPERGGQRAGKRGGPPRR